jgi:hypothetical protein
VSNGGFDLPFGGGSVLVDQPGNHFYVCVPHAAGGMKGIINVFVTQFQGSLTDSVSDGWNLLSVPFLAEDTLVTGLYPGATSQAFVYLGGYSAQASVSNGPGYWIKFGGAQEVSYSGPLVASDSVPVAQGWNILGSVSDPVAVASISSIPGGLVTSPFYAYDGGYSVADSIFPGAGYWVKVSAPGTLIVGPSAGAVPAAGKLTIVPGGELPPLPPVLTSYPDPSPSEFGLVRSYPNPFNPSTRISYLLDREARVKVTVYDLAGETVATLVDRVEGPGAKTVDFDGEGLAGGVYIVRVAAGTDAGAVKVVLVK